MSRIDQLTADDFVPYVDRVFRPAGTDLSLVLTRIRRNEFPGWEAIARAPFSLILRGPPCPVLAEGLHCLAVADGPVLTLYVIPVLTAGRGHQDYQIVFN
ncbi:MAG TPA: hypothetical protein VNV18_17380 [Stellaceae bacterium]|jgi:hypothetical protein|nr:hypothetical protein [Stellaceae bacterium]